MLAHEILALHSLEDKLRWKLKDNLVDIIDYLYQDGVLDSERHGDEWDAIHNRLLTRRQRVSELLKRLSAMSGDRGERAFASFLKAVRRISIDLEEEAECIEDTSQSLAAENVLFPEAGLEWKSSSIITSHSLPSALPAPTRSASECLEIYRSHLLSICGEQRWKSLLPERNTRGADIADWFVSVQAMDRWHGSCGNESQTSSAHLGERFSVSDPVQLLMHYPHLYESAMDVDEIEFVKSCMVVSSAGTGKTTLCRQLLGNYTRRAQSRLQEKFPFPVYIQCSDVDRLNSTDWETVLGVNDEDLMTALSSAERKLVVDYLLGHAEQLLLIIDGVDEVSEGMFAVNGSKLSGVLCCERKVLKRASLFITSRSCSAASHLSSECAGLYTLAGFTEEQLKQYMVKRLGIEKGERCMATLCEVSLSHVKEAILGVPLFAVLVAEEYDRAGEIPLNVTSLYGGYLAHAQLRWTARRHRKRRPSKEKSDSDEPARGEADVMETSDDHSPDTEGDHHLHSRSAAGQDSSHHRRSKPPKGMFEKLSAKALEMLCRRQRSSSAAFFTPEVADFGHAIGVLNINETLMLGDNGTAIEFNHVSYQEYLAATQVSHDPSPVEVAEQCVERIGTGEETWPFWQFLCGLVDSRHLPAIILLLRGGTERVAVPKKLTCFLMLCLLENQSQSTTQPDHVEAAEAISGCRLDFSYHRLNKLEIAGLVNVLRQISCEMLVLMSSGITGDQVKQLGDHLPLISHVILAGNNLHGYPLEHAAAAFHRATRVKNRRLDLQLCELSDEDGVFIARLMQFTTLLDLHQSDASVFPAIARSMASSPNLKQLSLQEATIPAGGGSDLCRIVEHAPNLTHLWLVGNCLTTDDASQLLVQLSGSRIQALGLENNAIDDDITTSLMTFLQATDRQLLLGSSGSERKDGCQIFLAGNAVHRSCLDAVLEAGCGVQSYVSIGPYFLKEGNLHKFDCAHELEHGKLLQGCGVNDDMAHDVAEFMAQDTSLSVLDLMDNQISDEGARYLATALKTNSTLQVLELSGNKIGISGLLALLEGMSMASRSPQALRLNRCPVFQSVSTSHPDLLSLLSQLKSAQCGNLRALVLMETGLTVEVGIMLAEALKWNKSLVMIGLGENRLDDVFAAALAQCLDGNTTLQEVELSKNQITEVGVQQMMQSPGVRRLQCVWMHGNPCPPRWYRHPLVNTQLIGGSEDMMRLL